MDLTRTSTQHIAATLVCLLLIIIFGLLAATKLPIQLLPDLQQPQISVFNNWRAAAPQEMEANIIEPQEQVLKRVPGVLEMESSISQGFGRVSLTFEVGHNMQTAMIDVINAINQTPPRPRDANEPFIDVGGGNTPNLASLLIRMDDNNPQTDFAQYQQLIDEVVEPRLRQITGVASVGLQGRSPKELHIILNPYRIAALKINLTQIQSAVIRAANISGGSAKVGRRQYNVRFIGQYTPEDLGRLIISYQQGRPVYLNEIAEIVLTTRDRNGFTKRNGYPAYYMTIQGGFDANTVEVLEGINLAIDELNQGALKQAGLIIELSFDASVHIKRAIFLVQSNIALGILLALLILYAFLRNLNATLMIASTIPVALLIAFVVLRLMDRSLNVISLAGLAFAVGLVLDAAIIVQENIVRLLQQGIPLPQAVIKGTTQVKGALLASTATTVAIFLPVLFMPGIEGQLFTDLALTLSVAVVSSFISAVTLIPVFSLLWLKVAPAPNHFASHPGSGTTTQPQAAISFWQRLSQYILALTGNNKRALIWCSLLIVGSSIITLLLLPRVDFLPQTKADNIAVFFSLPAGANIDTLERETAATIIQRLKPYYEKQQQPYIRGYNLSMYTNFNAAFIYPEDPKQVETMIDILKKDIFVDLPDLQAFVNRGSLLRVGFNGGRSITLDLQGPELPLLLNAAEKGMTLLEQTLPDAVVRPIPSLSLAQPELQLLPSEHQLAQAGLDKSQLAQAIRAYTSGLFVGEYFDGNERMDVLLRSPEWQTPEQLAALPIHTPNAGVQTIGELTDIQRAVGPTQLQRINGKRTVSLLIIPPDGMSLDEALSHIKHEVLPKLKNELTADYMVKFRGNADKLQHTLTDMGYNFLLALVILFLLMAAMFNSAKDSLLVLLSMPLAMAGGVVSLWILNLFTFQSLDLLTMIGFIILLGLVVNNAILLVDQTRQGLAAHHHIDTAIYQAVRSRARPVYMSTLTSIFGMLPLALIPGIGSEIYRGLAVVIVGGMTFSALFTLILMPSLLRLTYKTTTKNTTTTPSLAGIHS
ncbi:efflux RND transporter permease subunit [uncultured Shewanella sp.]|uniref:efflux RND transporter permease subunit n=1 Tax=uncultured Shewanella sp. TaxID=173975 RepID=UPI002609C00A|nr:efflux RND transporter permease subunit [uncultured Shewanella sp.]